MKLTVEISDLLLKLARRLASKEHTTLKALVQEGLRRLIAARSPKPFKLGKVSFKAKGLQPEMADASWERIRDAIYEGREARSQSVRASWFAFAAKRQLVRGHSSRSS